MSLSAYQRAVFADKATERQARWEDAEASVERHLIETGEVDRMERAIRGEYDEDAS